jgi:hypothetical protein
VSKKEKPSPPIALRAVPANKPDLIVHAADLTVTARAVAKLLAEQCENLFVQDYKVVIVEPGDDDDGMPSMRPAGANEIIIAAHKYCQPVRRKSAGERVELTLPDKVAELYLAMPDEWRLRPLRGITTAPILHDDGSIRWERGYDAATGLLCACNVPALNLPDKPSFDDAKGALATLRHAFRTFAFADRIEVDETFSVGGDKFTVKVVDLKQPPGKDESGHLAALLSGVARFSLPLAPGYHIVSPPHSGSGVGKGMLAHAISIVAYGKKASAAGLGERKEELDKGLTDELLSGEQCILLDNLNNVTLRSRLLCVALGESDAKVRRLGAGMEAIKAAFINVTGNGLKLAEDLVRRFITSDLDARCENPETRRFAGDFLTDITQQRAELLRAVLIIWRYGRQTKLKSKGAPPLGGFEQWTSWVRDPLVALDCQDPVAKIAKLKTADPVRLAAAEIFQTWWKHHRKDKVTANDLHETVKALFVPDPNKRSRQNVASLVSRLDGTRLAGFHLCSNKDDDSKGRWTPVSYWLEQVETESQQTTDDPDDFYFNHEPDDAAVRPDAGGIAFVMTSAMKQQLRARGFSDEQIDNLTPPQAHDILNAPQAAPAPPEQPPLPSDPVERWRTGFARLDPMRDPCAGFRTGEFSRVHSVISTFLAGPFAKQAVDAGWTELELVGVHPEVGVARPNACGALMTNAYGSPVTQVRPQLIRFANGLAVYKARLSVGNSVAVWNHRETAANECATCRTGSPP